MKKTYYFADIETSMFKEKAELLLETDKSYQLDFKLGCIVSFDIENDKELYFYHSENLDDYCLKCISNCSRKNKKIIFFHNLKFDSKFLIDYINAYFDEIKIIRNSGNIIAIRCYKTRTYISKGKRKYQNDCILELRDSLSLLITSIKNLGKMVKLDKLEFDFDYSNKELALEYCKIDCIIIYKSMIYLLNFLNDTFNVFWNFQNLPLTIASLSKKLIKMFYPDVFYRNDKYNEQLLRKYYFGGRTEVFNFNRIEKAHYVDINSAYPNSLSKDDFSYGKCFIFKETEKLRFNDKNVLGMELTIKENQYFPLYPTRINKKVMFVNGIKQIIMSSKEYHYLLKSGYFKKKCIEILEIHSVLIANQKINFGLFFASLYKIRKSYKSEHPYNYFLKIILNSGYGKFGQNPNRKEYSFINPNVKSLDFDDSEIYDNDDSESLSVIKEVYNRYLENNLINAVLTTSYVRFQIWIMLEFCKLNNIIAYYTDTDSVVISDSNLTKLKKKFISNDLGNWSIETTFNIFQAVDSKEYFTYNNKNEFQIKYKGIANKMFEKEADLSTHITDGTRVNIVGSFFYCMIRKSDNKSVFVIEKHKRSYYHKRLIQKDLSTNPVNLNDNLEHIEQSNKTLILNQLGI